MSALTVGEWLLLGWGVPMLWGVGITITGEVTERAAVERTGRRIAIAGGTGACVTLMTGALIGLYPTSGPPVVTAVAVGVVAILINVSPRDIQRLLGDQGGETA